MYFNFVEKSEKKKLASKIATSTIYIYTYILLLRPLLVLSYECGDLTIDYRIIRKKTFRTSKSWSLQHSGLYFDRIFILVKADNDLCITTRPITHKMHKTHSWDKIYFKFAIILGNGI